MKAIKGIIPAMLTPLKADESVDFEKLRELMEDLQARGVHGIFVLGTQGEFYAFNTEERKKIIEVAVDCIKSNKTLYVGTGSITTKETIELTKYAYDVGADFAAIITPYLIRTTQEEMILHYEKIANAVDMPILLYNNPSATGNNLLPESVKALSEIDNIVGIKDSTPNFEQLSKLIRITSSEKFSVLVGLEPHILGGLLLGAKGAIAASANVIPEILVELYNAVVSGDIIQAAELQDKVNKFFDLLHLSTFPGTVKDIMIMLGKNYGPARSPIINLPKEKHEVIEKLLKELGLKEH